MDWFLISIQSCSVQCFFQKKILRNVKRDFPTVIFIIPRLTFNSFDGTLPGENFEFEKIVSSETKHRQPWGAARISRNSSEAKREATQQCCSRNFFQANNYKLKKQ